MKRGLLVLHLMAVGLWAQGKDVKGSMDHPLVGRFEGSVITYYSMRDFEEAKFLKAAARTPGNAISAEGKLTDLSYAAPAGRSSLEVFRNFQERMKAAGFAALYTCEKEACGNTNYLLNESADARATGRTGFSAGFTGQPRFGSYRLQSGGNDVFAAIYVGEFNGTGYGPFVNVRVLERKAMETGKIVVPTASQMSEAIAGEGRIALYGIYFDTGLAVVKPESAPTLEQIAALLKANPKLIVLVVGHTDNVGEFQANVALSQKRATAVVDALVKQHGVAAARMQAVGVGMSAPAATNADEAGRAKNRRVELVGR